MTPRSPLHYLGAIWGVLGVVALLCQAIYRLTPRAIEPIQRGLLDGWETAIYVAWVVFSLYFEGYRAFQLRFSPRVVARALHLIEQPTPLHVALAPAFCMAFFHASRRARILAWATTIMVVFFIVALRGVPQPWRGIVDGGVVLALAWGAAAIVIYFVRGLSGASMPVSAELPEPRAHGMASAAGPAVRE
jgi:hypothetical protein